ncbi:TonB-dependent siderophore receptor [Rhizobium sp. SSA_523]|uniref:TonB-dependent siderophore receptor n=1 Tax=Rhizobium sp. SSA_523 TaxID=2952477 RepID=UPI002091B888|nr:TonB-dependent siderophore receptor [Rhizobium sp. SSA_523]MCO5734229.1 TonB-dependent siderophore receptor [Rhizobium sp. SSA_523]WKC22530.1 TonB-dependent siderophore receptor [Rhizobium sp. SSA_523]
MNGMKTRGVAHGLVVVAAVMGAGRALAQEASLLLPRIAVEGSAKRADAPVDGYVARRSSAGSKTNTVLRDIPQSVSVIGRDELDDRGVVNKVDEALRYTPGVATEPFGSDPDTDWIYIRGFDATQTGIFFDGLNLYSYGFGGFQIDPFALERVDVLKGPSSVLYGGGNAGGIVNLVRKRPTGEPYFYTEAGINSNGNAFFGFDLSAPLSDIAGARYRLTGKIAGGDNYSDYSEDLRGFIMPQVTLQPDDATELNLWAYVSALDQVHTGNGFFPYVGTVVDAPFGKLSRDSFYGEPSLDEGRSNQEMVGYDFSHEFETGWTLSSNARYSYLYKHEIGPYLFGYVGGAPTAPDYPLNRIGFEETSKVDSLALDNRAETVVDLGGAEHSIMLGLDYKYYRLDHRQASGGATPIRPINPIYGTPQGPTAVYLDQDITQQQVGAYVQDQIRFGDGWLVTLNGRADYVHTQTDNGATAYSSLVSSYDYDKTALSGRAGLAYEFDNGLTPYASIGTFFNPTIAPSATPNNKPEEGEQYEIGFKYEPTAFDGSFTAALFHLERRNVVVTDPATFLAEQIGKVQSRGIELEGKVNLDDNWKMLASYSYTDLEVKEDIVSAYVGKSPYLVPESQASLWLDYAVTEGPLDGLSLGAGIRYQGESYADRLNSRSVPDATVFDAAIRYKKNGWEAALNVANVFDKDYVRGCGGEFTCGYGEARTVTLKISKTW